MNTKGDIIEGVKTVHPIVYLGRINSDQFLGCMITHSSTERFKNNIGLKPEHFIEKDEFDNPYSVRFENSFFVNLKLVKENDWGPYTKSGRLTDDGVFFIESYLQRRSPISWNNYIKRMKHNQQVPISRTV